MSKVTFTFRPFRFLYLVGLTVAAVGFFGWGAAILVGLAAIDLEVK